MSEPLDLDLPTKRIPTLIAQRPLDRSTLDNLGPRDAAPTRVAKFRDSHHAIARCYALGLRDCEVAAQTGYSLSRLSILKSDPAFGDLIERYRSIGDLEHQALVNVMNRVMMRGYTLMDESFEATHDKGVPLGLGELRPIMDIVSDLADRVGTPKHSVNTQVNLSLGDRIESARKRTPILDLQADKEPV